MESNKHQLSLRIILEQPPAGVDFGLQKGRGSLYDTVQTQRSASSDLSFEFTVEVEFAGKDLEPSFRGPFVQGPREERFVYIDIGTMAGQAHTPWSRRLKVPLRGITLAMIKQSMAKPGTVLEARVPGTGSDGGPSCASVKHFQGWTPASG